MTATRLPNVNSVPRAAASARKIVLVAVLNGLLGVVDLDPILVHQILFRTFPWDGQHLRSVKPLLQLVFAPYTSLLLTSSVYVNRGAVSLSSDPLAVVCATVWPNKAPGAALEAI